MKHTCKDFALIHKNVFNDNRLSWQAKGLLAYAIALEGIDNALFTDSMMSELEKYGYLIVEKTEKGKPIYHFFDNPADSPEYSEMKRKSDKRKRKGANYKKILSDALGGITWNSKEFVVHHINHDRGDNRVNNLLLLPKKLHSKYHLLFEHVHYSNYSLTDKSTDSPYVNQDMVYALVEARQDITEISNVQEQLIFAMEHDSYINYFYNLFRSTLLKLHIKYK